MNRIIHITFAVSLLLAYHVCADTYRELPVVVNILSNSGVSVAVATAAVQKVNDYYRTNGMNVRLRVVHVNPAFTSGDNGDGNLTDAEGDAVQAAGCGELTNRTGGKGVKITFAGDCWVGSGTPGWSRHRNPSIVVEDRKTNSLTAETIFHELGHVFTLCGVYDIDGTNQSDEAGHAPNVNTNWGAGNGLAPSDYRNGVTITSNQKARIENDGVLDGMGVAVTNNPATNAPAQRVRDHYGRFMRTDTNTDVYSVGDVMLHGDEASGGLFGQVCLGGLFPPGPPMPLWVHLLFDSDNNMLTGDPVGTFQGIDRELILLAFWEGSAVGGTQLALVHHPNGLVTNPMGPFEASVAIRTADLSTQPPIDKYQVFNFTVPEGILGITATNVPVGVIVLNQSMVMTDRKSFAYRMNDGASRPSLLFEGNQATVGEPVNYTVAGLAPGPFTLYMEDQAFFAGTVLGDGTASGFFPMPMGSIDETYYFTAQDGAGNFGFSVMKLVPEPALLACLGCLAILLRRARS